MIKINVEFTVTGLNHANDLLTKETKENSDGLILGVHAAKYVGEILAAIHFGNQLRVTVLPSLPGDAWILYNNLGMVFSDS